MEINLNVTDKIREYMGTVEYRDTVKRIVDSNGTSSSATVSSETIRTQVQAYLSSNEGKRAVLTIVSDLGISQKVKDCLNTYEGKQLVRDINSTSGYVDQQTLDRKLSDFCRTDSFRSHVTTAIETPSYWERVGKQMFENAIMTANITTLVNKIAPIEVEREIKRQLREIILEKFDSILKKELEHVLPSMVQGYCNQYVPPVVNQLVPPAVQQMLPGAVQYEIQQQFPTYLQTNPSVQNMLSSHVATLNLSLQQTAGQELERIVSEPEHQQLATQHLDAMHTRCNSEIAALQGQVQTELMTHARNLHTQYQEQSDKYSSYAYQTQTYVDTQLQNFTNGFNKQTQNLQSDYQSKIGSIRNLQTDSDEVKKELSVIGSYVRFGTAVMICLVGCVAYLFFSGPKTAPVPTFKLT